LVYEDGEPGFDYVGLAKSIVDFEAAIATVKPTRTMIYIS